MVVKSKKGIILFFIVISILFELVGGLDGINNHPLKFIITLMFITSRIMLFIGVVCKKGSIIIPSFIIQTIAVLIELISKILSFTIIYKLNSDTNFYNARILSCILLIMSYIVGVIALVTVAINIYRGNKLKKIANLLLIVGVVLICVACVGELNLWNQIYARISYSTIRILIELAASLALAVNYLVLLIILNNSIMVDRKDVKLVGTTAVYSIKEQLEQLKKKLDEGQIDAATYEIMKDELLKKL